MKSLHLALLFAALFCFGRAHADDAGVSLPPTPPQLIAQSEPVYPPEALAQRIEASVLLALTIDTTGAVNDVQVLEPAGHGFDEAVAEAARSWRFSPALKDGQPVAARIRSRYTFALPPLAAAPPPPPAAPVTVTEPAQATSVTVQGAKSEAEQLVHSAEAVSVIDLRTARQQTADLGQVLARTPGISVEREAGLGSNARISLAGLQGTQVKYFVDGIPLEEAGFPALADIPINLIERVEIYRGVVPIRFGSDALGGAVNVVTSRTTRSHIGGSYQVGAFNTHRATLSGRYYNAERGLVAGGSSYFDYSDNSYKVDVSIPGDDGRPRSASVRRSHDAYRAVGGNVDIGVVNRPWARRLLLTGFVSSTFKEFQSNASQTAAFGELRGHTSKWGATLRYEADLAPNLAFELVANYAHENDHFIDLSNWVYDWYGQRGRMRRVGGEINGRRKSDLRTWQDAIFGRAILQWSITPEHILRASSTPSTPWRGGHEAVVIAQGERDKGDGRRRMISVVSGLEYEANLFGDRLSNVAFVKHYWQSNRAEDPQIFAPGDAWVLHTNTVNYPGIGDSLRLRVMPWLYAKGSYEFAARLPEPEEYFGDGLLIGANYELLPERSHNGNLGFRAELSELPIGDLTIDVNGFLRETRDLIMLVGLQLQNYANVHSSLALGVDTAFSYVSPGRYVALNGMLSWQDVRNTSEEGTYKPFKGERIPSRPWLFASWGARLSFPDVLVNGSRIEPFYNGRYVHTFNRSWDNYGDAAFKIRMPSQMSHSVGVTWLFSGETASTSVTLEIDNLANAALYDYFGAQRPGRAFYAKVTGDLR
jgi:vitamin B12 transporter